MGVKRTRHLGRANLSQDLFYSGSSILDNSPLWHCPMIAVDSKFISYME